MFRFYLPFDPPLSQIPSPPSVRVARLNDPLATYNAIWRADPERANDLPLTHKSFQDEAGKFWTDNLQNWKSSATFYTHCELTLAVYLLRPSPPLLIELGVSKACCWLCVVFLELLAAQAHVRIVVSGTHAKPYGSWQFPPDLQEHLREPIRSSLTTLTRLRLAMFLQSNAELLRRASDSQYHSSGDDSDPDIDDAREWRD
jgi:hypothetical protein